MSVQPRAGKGTQLKIGDGAEPEVFNVIPGVQDIDGPDLAGTDEYDATHHESAAKEYVQGLKDAGEFSFPLVYDSDDTQQAILMAAAESDVLKNFQMVLTDRGNTQLDFAARVKGFKFNAPVENILTVSVTLRITGVITRS